MDGDINPPPDKRKISGSETDLIAKKPRKVFDGYNKVFMYRGGLGQTALGSSHGDQVKLHSQFLIGTR